MKGVSDLHAWVVWVLPRGRWCWHCCALVGEGVVVVVDVVAVRRRGFGVVKAESGRGSVTWHLVVEAASVREGGVVGGSWGWRVLRGW